MSAARLAPAVVEIHGMIMHVDEVHVWYDSTPDSAAWVVSLMDGDTDETYSTHCEERHAVDCGRMLAERLGVSCARIGGAL